MIKKMRLITVLLLIIGLANFSCNKNDDVEESVKYTLTVENTTSQNVDIYLNGHLDNSGFVSEGTVSAGTNKKIQNLVVNVNYTLRAVVAGEPLEDFFDEQNFVNKDAEKFDVTIQIIE